MRITVKEIAKLANVSPTTVSKVLNHRDMNISDATKSRILSIVSEYGYVPNLMAKSLRGNRTNTLGFILPDITNPFFAQIARGIEDAAQKKNFSVVFSDTDNDSIRERTALNYLTSRMIDGIIFAQTIQPSNIDHLPHNIPIVVIDRLANIDDSSVAMLGKVYSDTKTAVYEMTMLHIHAGCKKLAFFSPKPASQLDRYYGFVSALEECGIPLYNKLLYWGNFDETTGVSGVNYLLESELDFDSIVCGNDLIAIGAMNTLKKHGYRIPADCRISGVDDIPLSRYLTPPLTTAKQFSYEMGEAAANMLIDNIVSNTPLTTLKINYQVKKRESV